MRPNPTQREELSYLPRATLRPVTSLRIAGAVEGHVTTVAYCVVDLLLLATGVSVWGVDGRLIVHVRGGGSKSVDSLSQGASGGGRWRWAGPGAVGYCLGELSCGVTYARLGRFWLGIHFKFCSCLVTNDTCLPVTVL